MNDPIRSLETLKRLLELTDKMLESAQSGRWEDISDLNAQRVQLLESPDEFSDADEDSHRRLSHLIKAADARLLADISSRLEQTAEAGIQQRSRSTAVRGYRDAYALRSPVTD